MFLKKMSHNKHTRNTNNAAINFIQNDSPGTNPRDTTRKGQNPPRDNHCLQKPSPRDKTGSQKPHRDIKLESFTNVPI